MSATSEMKEAAAVCGRRRSRRPHLLVAGLGNELLRDDGVGVHAVRALQRESGDDLCVVEIGTAVLDALHLFEWADHVLAIDAMQAHGLPGTIQRFTPDDVLETEVTHSLHEAGLLVALRFLSREWITPDVMVLGVEPAVIDYGLDLTPDVARAVPRLVDVVHDQLERWRRAAD